MDQRTKIFLKKKFQEYYTSLQLEMPPVFRKREWAFVPLENLPNFVMYRHMSFEFEEEFKAYILNNVPANIFYSSAYYAKPSAEYMELKGWQGADLIFDIDADHLPLKSASTEVALNVAKREVIRLANILISDFGVSKGDIKIVFSGSRGYHLHVYDERFKSLGSAERREIIDYLTMNDVSFGFQMPETSQAERVSRCMTAFFMNSLKKNRLSDILKKYGIRGKSAERVLGALSNRDTLRLIARGDLSFLSGKRVRRMIEDVINTCISKVSVHVDAPVTADVKRLIRFPNSLHGKTGLKAVPIDLDEIKDFNPLRDAIAFGEEKVKVRAKSKIREKIGEEEIKLSTGEKALLPEFAAIFLLCKGLAVYGH